MQSPGEQLCYRNLNKEMAKGWDQDRDGAPGKHEVFTGKKKS